MIVAFFRNHLIILLVLPGDSALESSYSSRVIYGSTVTTAGYAYSYGSIGSIWTGLLQIIDFKACASQNR
jgi:hypothetical protein